MSMYRVTALLIFLSFFSCQEETTPPAEEDQTKVVEVLPDLFYGIDRNQFTVQTPKKLNAVTPLGRFWKTTVLIIPEVYSILQAIKGKVNIRKLTIGKPYSLFYSKDSIPTPEYFVYHPGPQSYTRIHLRDSLYGDEIQKPVRLVELEASGIIESSLYETMQNSGINEILTYYLSDIYAWTVDFFRLQKGDRFKGRLHRKICG